MKENYPIIRLKRGKEKPVQRNHPWIFSGAFIKKPTGIENGDIVVVADHLEKYIATGHFHDGSIMVRILSTSAEPIDFNFWKKKITKAHQYRSFLDLSMKNSLTNAYRFFHGEGDGVSGLIIDNYNGNFVIQCHTVGCHRSIGLIKDALLDAYGSEVKSIFQKSSSSLPDNYGRYEGDGFLYGKNEKIIVKENGVKFYVDMISGQKTGFFLDQRENRKLLGKYAKGKDVLNLFCYTGGFSMYALSNGATRVTSVDISQQAIEMVRENHILNSFETPHDIYCANVMKMLENRELPQYDIVVVDPPAFAKSVKKRHNAVKAYKRINALALKKVKKGGLLFTFSCSQVVEPELFYSTIRAAAIESKRRIKIIHYMSQGPDHPVNIYFPEGRYLKGLVLYVD